MNTLGAGKEESSSSKMNIQHKMEISEGLNMITHESPSKMNIQHKIIPGVRDSVTMEISVGLTVITHKSLDQDADTEVNLFVTDIFGPFLKSAKGAVFVKLEYPNAVLIFNILMVAQGFKPHHVEKDKFVVYLNPFGNEVPPYATATVGVGAFITFDEVETRLLLVHENKKMKLVTGTVDAGEDILEALYRDALEEVNIKITKELPLFLCGWHEANNPSVKADNCFFVFHLKAASLYFKPDGKEIKRGRWYDIKWLEEALPIYRAKRDVCKTEEERRRFPTSTITYMNEDFSPMVFKAIESFKSKASEPSFTTAQFGNKTIIE